MTSMSLDLLTCVKEEAAFCALHGIGKPATLRSKLIGSIDLMITAFGKAQEGQILQFFLELIEKTGTTFEQCLLAERGIDTIDPANVEAVLSTQFKDFGLGDRRACFFPLLGEGIFTQDGVSWKHSRELIRPQFMSNRTQNFSEIRDHVEDLITCIPASQAIDLQPLFFRLTLNTTMFLLFGRSIDFLKLRNQAGSADGAFAEAFNLAQDFLARRGRLGSLYWLIGGRKFRKANKTVHRFLDGVIYKALEARNDPKLEARDKDNYVFLDALIDETKDPVFLRSQLLNILLAGRDTTACCLSWSFRLLARHQHVLEKLRAEIAEKVGTEPPTQADLKTMPYLNHVLKEVLRLYPSVPVNSRAALRRTTLPVGGGPSGESPILVRKGEAVGYCTYAMHRRCDIFGEDADEFRPERWENGLEKRTGWAYLPFNGGPRICLGQDFALLEAGYTIVRVLQAFPHLTATDNPEAQAGDAGVEGAVGSERHTLTLVLSSAEGCWVKMRRDE